MFGWDVALHDGDEACQPGFGGQQIVVVGIVLAGTDRIPQSQEMAVPVVQECEIHGQEKRIRLTDELRNILSQRLHSARREVQVFAHGMQPRSQLGRAPGRFRRYPFLQSAEGCAGMLIGFWDRGEVRHRSQRCANRVICSIDFTGRIVGEPIRPHSPRHEFYTLVAECFNLAAQQIESSTQRVELLRGDVICPGVHRFQHQRL